MAPVLFVIFSYSDRLARSASSGYRSRLRLRLGKEHLAVTGPLGNMTPSGRVLRRDWPARSGLVVGRPVVSPNADGQEPMNCGRSPRCRRGRPNCK
jgi:hypothetical protein